MEIVNMEELQLIGLALKSKTTNEGGRSSQDCENLWHEFHKNKYADSINDKLSEDIYGVYHDYEGDSSKPFSYFIGYKVKENAELPAGLQRLTIPGGKYEKITAQGKMPDCVTAAWKQIWESPAERAYKTDFEIYDHRSKDWAKAEVDVYVSVK